MPKRNNWFAEWMARNAGRGKGALWFHDGLEVVAEQLDMAEWEQNGRKDIWSMLCDC